MACPAVLTGSEFLVRTLAHLDCQAQTLGSFGFQSLAAPGSPAAAALTALLTLFVAIYGIRLLFVPGDEPRELVTAFLKIGIVLTIAVSWPAWRTVAYDTVLYGPSEIAASIMPSTMPDPRAEFPQRLQNIDSALAAVTLAGTGRLNAETLNPAEARQFQSVALGDEQGLGWSRPVFLTSTIGSLGLLRIAAGLLLALAPLFAGLLLFDATRGLFVGWLRGLVLTAVGSLALTVLLSVQVAVMEPWLADVLNRRAVGAPIPTAPTEMLALVTAFAVATAGLLFLLGRVTFHQAWAHRPAVLRNIAAAAVREPAVVPTAQVAAIPVHSRALAISESVQSLVRRESTYREGVERVPRIGVAAPGETGQRAEGRPAAAPERLGSGYRRTVRSEMPSHRQRNDRT